MKTMFKITIFTALVFMTCACRSITPVTSAVFQSERDGTITISSTGVGNTQTAAQVAAEQNAFNTLLFRGFPESSQKTPLIGYDEASIKQKYAKYFNELYENRRYRSFVTGAQPVGSFSKRLQTVELTINLRALRSDLEQNGILRKFGY